MVILLHRNIKILTQEVRLWSSCLFVKQYNSFGHGTWQSDRLKSNFECKLVDALQPLMHDLATSEFSRKYRPPRYKVQCRLLYSQLLATCKYMFRAQSTTVSTNLRRH